MRLGEKRIICMRGGRSRKRKLSVLPLVLLVVTIIVYTGISFFKTARSVMIDNAKTEAHRIAQKAINDAVLNVFASSGISYEEIVVLKRADDGKIVAAESNLSGVARLKTEITKEIQSYISNLNGAEVRIPLGAFFGTDLFAGSGPIVTLEFMPDAVTNVDFVSEFENGGINQTRLTVELDVKTKVGMIMPGADTYVTVRTNVPIIQTVIVGEVPQSYTNVERDGYEFEDDVLELAE